MAAVQLVPVQTCDRDQFMEMSIRYNRELNSSFEPTEEWMATYFDAAMSRTTAELLWIRTTETVGFTLIGREPHPFRPDIMIGHIFEFYVEPQFRASGLAQVAAHQALDHLAASGCGRIELEVLNGNDRAKRFWMKLGFESTSARYVLSTDTSNH